MSKTIELRKAIVKMLKTLDILVFYEEADSKAIYPYIVYELDSFKIYKGRDDYTLIINIWDKSKNSSLIEKLADEIEKIFDYENIPVGNILPTFYFESKNSIRDEDKDIKRRELKFLISNYYTGGA